METDKQQPAGALADILFPPLSEYDAEGDWARDDPERLLTRAMVRAGHEQMTRHMERVLAAAEEESIGGPACE